MVGVGRRPDQRAPARCRPRVASLPSLAASWMAVTGRRKLGPTRPWTRGGQRRWAAVAVGAGKPRALLAMLALNAGSTVSSDRLIDGLWGDPPPATAEKLVQLYVSQLRKALAAAGNGARSSRAATATSCGSAPDELDARASSGSSPADGRARRWPCGVARRSTTSPASRSPPPRSAGSRSCGLRRRARDRARPRRGPPPRGDSASSRRWCSRAAARAAARAADAGALPLRPPGRRARGLPPGPDALVEQIGVEPGPELRRLHEAILRQDPGLDLPAREPPSCRPSSTRARRWSGREAELGALREHWRRARAGAGRLVLMAGARGMGKTRLAAELAAEVPRDGGAVLYASGAGSPDAARRVIERCARRAARRCSWSTTPTTRRRGSLAELGATRRRRCRCSCSRPPRRDRDRPAPRR